MDFYLQPLHFLTDLAVDAKSCLNSNIKFSYENLIKIVAFLLNIGYTERAYTVLVKNLL